MSDLLFQAHLPFAVVGSGEEVKVGNKLVRARQYPWGVVQGEHLLTYTSGSRRTQWRLTRNKSPFRLMLHKVIKFL